MLTRSTLVVTDSGGLQEEAPSFGLHTVVLRETTERPEALDAGLATIVGTDEERMVAEILRRCEGSGSSRGLESRANPFGDGFAAERIARIVMEYVRGMPEGGPVGA
jgi:UDP-N-acetylglucosamine 2-epimerase (non-hydrolysing)